MGKKKIDFMCTAFRDGFQSVFGARVFTKDFLPAVQAAKEAGINYFEAGGGARFQSLYFYCNEDAFEMMDSFREAAGPDANLQTLARGVNVVGLESQPSDVIEMHAKLFKKHGITTIRNFDALNDVDNLIFSGQSIANAGLKHQVCVTMMELPPGSKGSHDPAFYEMTLKKIIDSDIPFDSVCFKDASGTAVPSKVYETIKRARKILPEDAYIHFHTHETAGISIATYKAAIDAGANAIDLSMMPASGGTCQPDILTMWHALRGTDYTLDIDIDKVRDAEEVFKDCMKDYFMPPESRSVEPIIPWSPMPGGALTANTQMLRDNGIMDKYPEIIKAMGDVVKKGGFGTSVTPVSQFYFQQAFNNVMFGPWEKIAESFGKMVLGYFGKTPVPADPDIIKLATEQLKMEPTTKTALEINNKDPKKGLKIAEEIVKKEGFDLTDENIFIVATCKDKGVKFLKGEAEVGVRKIDKTKKSDITADSGNFIVTVNETEYSLQLDGKNVIVDGQSFNVDMKEASEADTVNKPEGKGIDIKAPMPGSVFKIIKPSGLVKKGETIIIIEAMKMETKITAPQNGTVKEIKFAVGAQFASGDVLAVLSV